MGKRYIDCSARELAVYQKKELLQSIADSEGRVLATETIGTVTPMLVNITNAEFVTSLGADIIMLNIFDVDHPVINGLPEVAPEDTIHEVKRLTGKMHASGILSESGEKILTKEDAEAFIEAGADIHHIGDSGYMGMALPENITAYSVAIRGKRHTYRRMAMSLGR